MEEDKRNRYTSILASNLPTLRKARSLSQRELADMIGVARSTIAAIESKKSMTWNMFLSVITVFARHDETKKYMQILGIDIDGIDEFLSGNTVNEVDNG